MRVNPTKFWDDAFLTAANILLNKDKTSSLCMTQGEREGLATRAAELADALYLEREKRMVVGP